MNNEHTGGRAGDLAAMRRLEQKKAQDEFNPHEVLRQVAEHYDALEDELAKVRRETQMEIAELKSENRQILQKSVKVQQEADRLAAIKNDLEIKLDECEGHLLRERAQSAELKRVNSNLDTELGWAREKVEMLEERLQEMTERAVKAQHEVEKLEMHNTSLAGKLESTDMKLEDERSQTSKLKTQLKKLQAELKSAQEKTDLVQTQHDDVNKRLDEEKRKFAIRITHDANHELIVLKKRISAALKSDLRDIEKLESIPMTPKIGENLRSQMAVMLRKLRDLGIDMYGE
jgi:chromosome segregation ATPase